MMVTNITLCRQILGLVCKRRLLLLGCPCYYFVIVRFGQPVPGLSDTSVTASVVSGVNTFHWKARYYCPPVLQIAGFEIIVVTQFIYTMRKSSWFMQISE